MKRRVFLAASIATAALSISNLRAGESEGVILEVTGNVEQTLRFTLPQLQALGVTKLATSTAWTEGTRQFEGVLARSVMAAAGPVKSDYVRAQALNDYEADIPLTDFADYDVILAWRKDGQMLSRRDKGPLWVVYPRDSLPHLREERFEHRWVWQLNRLFVP